MTLTLPDKHTHRLRHILLLCVFIAGLFPTDVRSHPISHCHDHGEIAHALLLKLEAAHHHHGPQHSNARNASTVPPSQPADFSDLASQDHNSNPTCHFRGKNTLIAKRGITSPDHESLALPGEQYYLPAETGLWGSYHWLSLPSRPTSKFIFTSTDLPPPSA